MFCHFYSFRHQWYQTKTHAFNQTFVFQLKARSLLAILTAFVLPRHVTVTIGEVWQTLLHWEVLHTEANFPVLQLSESLLASQHVQECILKINTSSFKHKNYWTQTLPLLYATLCWANKLHIVPCIMLSLQKLNSETKNRKYVSILDAVFSSLKLLQKHPPNTRFGISVEN